MSDKIAIKKVYLADELQRKQESAWSKYESVFVGRPGLSALLRFELITSLAGPMPGALGYLLRKKLFATLLRSSGDGVQWGRNIGLRHPNKMEIGDGAVFDDGCLLDARGVRAGEFVIGSYVLVARNTAIQAKTDKGTIQIGSHSVISNNCTLTSAGGIRIGAHVGIGGHSYVGGARYETADLTVPMISQPMYSNGSIVIGDDCWIGAGVRILDGVTIGAGCVIGAGAVIRENIPPQTVVTPHQKLVMVRRETLVAQCA